jgi:hypothetical protein
MLWAAALPQRSVHEALRQSTLQAPLHWMSQVELGSQRMLLSGPALISQRAFGAQLRLALAVARTRQSEPSAQMTLQVL